MSLLIDIVRLRKRCNRTSLLCNLHLGKRIRRTTEKVFEKWRNLVSEWIGLSNNFRSFPLRACWSDYISDIIFEVAMHCVLWRWWNKIVWIWQKYAGPSPTDIASTHLGDQNLSDVEQDLALNYMISHNSFSKYICILVRPSFQSPVGWTISGKI